GAAARCRLERVRNSGNWPSELNMLKQEPERDDDSMHSDRALMSRPQSLQGAMNQHLRSEPVPFIDLAAQRRRLGKSVDEAVSRVLAHCQFINGPEAIQLESQLAAFSGARHVVTCASGTDALLMVLMAKGVGRGDAVLCPSFTFCA